jgi:hypothetical protein
MAKDKWKERKERGIDRDNESQIFHSTGFVLLACITMSFNPFEFPNIHNNSPAITELYLSISLTFPFILFAFLFPSLSVGCLSVHFLMKTEAPWECRAA